MKKNLTVKIIAGVVTSTFMLSCTGDKALQESLHPIQGDVYLIRSIDGEVYKNISPKTLNVIHDDLLKEGNIEDANALSKAYSLQTGKLVVVTSVEGTTNKNNLVRKKNTFNSNNNLATYGQSPLDGNIDVHVQDTGWINNIQLFGGGPIQGYPVYGTTGLHKNLEAFKVNYPGFNFKGITAYRAHVAGIGWQDWKTPGQVAGTTGLNKAIEAVTVKFVHDDPKLKVFLQAHGKGRGWGDEIEIYQFGDYSATSGSTGLHIPMEAFRLVAYILP